MILFYKQYIHDILNWFYFRKIVSRYEHSPQWDALNLRRNGIGEIYTIVNVRDEDLGDPDEVLELRMREVTKEHHSYIASMDIQFNLGGLVVFAYYHIGEQYPNAFLVIWQPNLLILSIENTIKFICLNLGFLGSLGGLGLLLSKFV